MGSYDEQRRLQDRLDKALGVTSQRYPAMLTSIITASVAVVSLHFNLLSEAVLLEGLLLMGAVIALLFHVRWISGEHRYLIPLDDQGKPMGQPFRTTDRFFTPFDARQRVLILGLTPSEELRLRIDVERPFEGAPYRMCRFEARLLIGDCCRALSPNELDQFVRWVITGLEEADHKHWNSAEDIDFFSSTDQPLFIRLREMTFQKRESNP